MDLRIPVLVLTVLAASLASATGTGPTFPEKSREHPLDSREPRQDVIDDRDSSPDQPRPPTLEAPQEGLPLDKSQDHRTEPDAAERSSDTAH